MSDLPDVRQEVTKPGQELKIFRFRLYAHWKEKMPLTSEALFKITFFFLVFPDYMISVDRNISNPEFQTKLTGGERILQM